jgi:glutaredoxin
MVELPEIKPGDDVTVFTLEFCPNCMILKDKLNLAKVKYKTMMADTAEGITEMRADGCFAVEMPVLRVNDDYYEHLFH